MNPNEAILNFIQFLNTSYSSWENSTKYILDKEAGYLEEIYDDWAQANWELLVERVLCQPMEYLELYGSGTDYESETHSRVFFQKALPTHEIKCRAAQMTEQADVFTGIKINPYRLEFERFVSIKEGKWDLKPPLQFVMLKSTTGESFFFPIDQITFTMEKK